MYARQLGPRQPTDSRTQPPRRNSAAPVIKHSSAPTPRLSLNDGSGLLSGWQSAADKLSDYGIFIAAECADLAGELALDSSVYFVFKVEDPDQHTKTFVDTIDI